MRIIAGEFKGRTLLSPREIRPTEDKVKKSLFDILRNVIPGSRFLDLYAGTGAVGIEALSRGAKEIFFVESDPANVKIIEQNIDKLKVGTFVDPAHGVDLPSIRSGYLEGSREKLRGSVNSKYTQKSNNQKIPIFYGGEKGIRSIDNRLYTILGFDAEKAITSLHSRKEKFDFIFLDPPYYKGGAPRLGSGSTLNMDPPESLIKKILQTLEAYDILNRNGFIIAQHHFRDKLPDKFGKFKLWRANKYSTTLLSFYR